MEEEPDREVGSLVVDDGQLSPSTSAHLLDDDASSPSPTSLAALPSDTRLHPPPPPRHRRRSGSVPCRRPRGRDDRPPRPRQLSVRRADRACGVRRGLSELCVPQIVVDRSQAGDRQPDDEGVLEESGRRRSKDVDVSPAAAIRRRCQTVSLTPSDDRRSPSLLLPVRRLSVSASPPTASGTVYTGEWIRLLLQRTPDVTAGPSRTTQDDDASVSLRPP